MLHHLDFDGTILGRGFWLYVWEISVTDRRTFYYVGKTGDKASGKSQSPFDRLSKHLGSNKHNNALLRHLNHSGIDPERCRFSFHACGPLFRHDSLKTHNELCDLTSGLEKALHEAMKQAGYVLLNKIDCRVAPDTALFDHVRSVFANQFDKLGGRA